MCRSCVPCAPCAQSSSCIIVVHSLYLPHPAYPEYLKRESGMRTEQSSVEYHLHMYVVRLKGVPYPVPTVSPPPHFFYLSSFSLYFIPVYFCLFIVQCVPISGLGFRRGSYKCVCRKGFYFPDTNMLLKYYNGSTLEEEYEKYMLVSSSRRHKIYLSNSIHTAQAKKCLRANSFNNTYIPMLLPCTIYTAGL